MICIHRFGRSSDISYDQTGKRRKQGNPGDLLRPRARLLLDGPAEVRSLVDLAICVQHLVRSTTPVFESVAVISECKWLHITRREFDAIYAEHNKNAWSASC